MSNGFQERMSEFRGSSKAKFEFIQRELDLHDKANDVLFRKIRKLEQHQSLSVAPWSWLKYWIKRIFNA